MGSGDQLTCYRTYPSVQQPDGQLWEMQAVMGAGLWYLLLHRRCSADSKAISVRRTRRPCSGNSKARREECAVIWKSVAVRSNSEKHSSEICWTYLKPLH